MIGRAAHAERDAGVLDGLVVISEESPCRAYAGLLGVVSQVFEPIVAHDFGVVIKENQKLARGRGRALIVGTGEIGVGGPGTSPSERGQSDRLFRYPSR